MRRKVAVVIVLAGMAVMLIVAVRHQGQKPIAHAEEPKADASEASVPISAAVKAAIPSVSTTQPVARPGRVRDVAPVNSEPPNSANKLERLAHTREYFRALAAGDHAAALTAAKGFTNAVERETSLLTLVTEWTHGDLRSPGERAEAISQRGLEAGLGMGFAKDPGLALLLA